MPSEYVATFSSSRSSSATKRASSPIRAFGPVRKHPGEVLQVLAPRQVRVEIGRLDDAPDVRHRAREIPLEVESLHADAPPVRPREADEHADRRRLSGAVRAEKPVHLALHHIEGHVGDGEAVAEALRQMLRGQNGGSHGRESLTTRTGLRSASGFRMIGTMASAASRFWLWRLPAVVGLAATALFAVGFALALRGATGKPIGQAPPAPASGIPAAPRGSGRLLLVLGDSLARGTGDESGRGFGSDLLDALRKRGPAEIANLGVNGAESDEVRDLLEKPNVRSLAASARWIVVSVGGNDLSHAAPRGDAAPAAPAETLAQARARYAANLRAILAALREANPSAPIRLLGLYDPFETPATAGRIGDSVVLGWNAVMQETALPFSDALVVPTFDLFAGARIASHSTGFTRTARATR